VGVPHSHNQGASFRISNVPDECCMYSGNPVKISVNAILSIYVSGFGLPTLRTSESACGGYTTLLHAITFSVIPNSGK